MTQSVLENLNAALHKLMSEDKAVTLLGEDLLDPYGGAFKVTKGLSTNYPERVITTPISELALTGIANGLSLSGKKPIAEYMFGDFSFLAFDQIANFAAKAPTMFGSQLEFPLILRIPVGGGRGYGPTHSQSPQKHFIGIPNLHLFELSPFYDCYKALKVMFDLQTPCLFFENKALYSNDFYGDNFLDNLFTVKSKTDDFTILELKESSVKSGLIMTSGSCFHKALLASKELFIETEIEIDIVVFNKLFPINISEFASICSRYQNIFTIEEGTPGACWGSEISSSLNFIPNTNWHILTSEDQIIPSSKHLEDKMLISSQSILKTILEIFDNA